MTINTRRSWTLAPSPPSRWCCSSARQSPRVFQRPLPRTLALLTPPASAGFFAWTWCPALALPAGPFPGQRGAAGAGLSSCPPVSPNYFHPPGDSGWKPGSGTSQTFIRPRLAPARLGGRSLPSLPLKGIACSFCLHFAIYLNVQAPTLWFWAA